MTRDGEVQSVRGVSFDVREGEVIGIVGESGSGKSVTAKSLIGLIPPPGVIREGKSCTGARICSLCRRSGCGRFGVTALR